MTTATKSMNEAAILETVQQWNEGFEAGKLWVETKADFAAHSKVEKLERDLKTGDYSDISRDGSTPFCRRVTVAEIAATVGSTPAELFGADCDDLSQHFLNGWLEAPRKLGPSGRLCQPS